MFPDRPTAQNKTKGSRISETSRLFERDASSNGSSDTWPSAAKQKMLTAAVGNSSSTQVRFVRGRINLKGSFPAFRCLDCFALARLIVHTCLGFLTLHTHPYLSCMVLSVVTRIVFHHCQYDGINCGGGGGTATSHTLTTTAGRARISARIQRPFQILCPTGTIKAFFGENNEA